MDTLDRVLGHSRLFQGFASDTSDSHEEVLYQDLESVGDDSQKKTLIYCIITCGALAILVWLILMVELVRVFRNFGKGLKERGKISFGAFTIGPAQPLGSPN